MGLRNSLILSLTFFLSTSLLHADHMRSQAKAGKPVVCAKTPNYNVGDRGPANGWIIFKRQAAQGQSEDTCWQYLEAAPSDQPGMMAWTNVTDKLVGGTGIGIGDGKENTKKIMAQAGHTASAAKSCTDLFVKNNDKTFHDWFLPSRDELDLMYQLLAKGDNKGGFVTKYNEAKNSYPWYWSSSELDENDAWYQGFVDGYQDYFNKSYTNFVRCARAF